MDKNTLRQEFINSTRVMQTFMHDTLAPICQTYDLTMQQYYILAELGSNPYQTVTSLSAHVGILRTNFALVCRKLEDRGLIERQRSATDRRSFNLLLTERGRELLGNVDAQIEGLFCDAFASEPPETFVTIERGLVAMRGFASRLNKASKHSGTVR